MHVHAAAPFGVTVAPELVTATVHEAPSNGCGRFAHDPASIEIVLASTAASAPASVVASGIASELASALASALAPDPQ